MKTLPACLVAACVASWAASPAAGQQQPERIERLERWLAAVERHAPGTADDPALEVGQWDRGTLRLIWVDLGTVVNLIREPDVGIFFAPPEPVSSKVPPRSRGPLPRPTQILYSRSELNALRLISKTVVERGGENRVLKRGAMLHADIAMHVPMLSGSAGQAGPQRITLFVADGQQAGFEEGASHWDMGRRLLDKVRPDGSRDVRPNPAADPAVRAWYVAGASYMQNVEQLEPWHIELALRLFPRDPDVLFFAACLHEALSAPQFQSVLNSMDVPRDVFFAIGSENAELRDAERLFRQLLEINPALNEARLRLGRVLGRRGRHAEAARELRQAVAATNNRLLLYYGTMFLGAEEEALGRLDEARQAYERAASLYQRAQSPRLALSALAARRGDRAAALDLLEPVLDRGEADKADDPWWSYHTAQTRSTDALLAELHRLLDAETRR